MKNIFYNFLNDESGKVTPDFILLALGAALIVMGVALLIYNSAKLTIA